MFTKKLFSLICALLFIFNVYATDGIHWHVFIKNNTESTILVGGLPTSPDGRYRANCWYTDNGTGSNQLLAKNQVLASGLGNLWSTYEMYSKEYDCGANYSTHYMEFMVNNQTVGLNGLFSPNPSNWGIEYQGNTIAEKAISGTDNDVYVELDYNISNKITAFFSPFYYPPIPWNVAIVNHTQDPIYVGGIVQDSQGKYDASCWLTDNSFMSNNQLIESQQVLASGSSHTWITNEMNLQEYKCNNGNNHYINFMINAQPVSLTGYYPGSPDNHWGVTYKGVSVGTKTMPASFDHVNVQLDYYGQDKVTATFN